MKHYKKGRPRKNRPAIDKGTVELQQKRKALIQQSSGQSLRLAESLLGVLHARKVLSKPLYEAGCFFGELGYRYEACLGEASPKRQNILTRKEGESFFSDEKDERDTKAWRRALGALKEAGPRSFQTVLKVVFYDQDLYTKRFPRILFKDLRKGLVSLDQYFRRGVIKDDQYTPDDRVENHERSTRIQRSPTDAQLQVLP